ncbi:MAG: CHASE2 domain-containing protein [Leptolyngbyaceae cyanobacterium RU_5_1]|nr:CHASE2 domain-containing protein [Leptolyngbyaceae cyanobacterium RU_5_1]
MAQFALPRLVPILPGITAGLLSLGLWQVGAWQALERVGYNSLFSFRQTLNRPRWDSRIVVIAIDKASLKQYGGFPWTRDSYTKLLRSLEVAPPAVIGLDIIFAESTSQDSSLAEAIAGIGNVVLATGADEEGQAIPIVPSLINVAPQGHVYNRSDSDGISRQAVLYFNQFPSFGIAALQVYQETIRTTIKAKVDRSASQAISLPPPTPGLPEQTAWINWIDTTQTIPTYSLKDVVQGKIPTQAFADKIVLVGATSTGLDPLHTPLNHTPPTSGVYLHAAVIDNLLNHRFLQSLPNHIVLPLLMLLGLGTNLILLHQKARGRVVLLAMLVLIWFSVAVACLLSDSTGCQLQHRSERCS